MSYTSRIQKDAGSVPKIEMNGQQYDAQVVLGVVSTPNVPILWTMNILGEMKPPIVGVLVDTVKPLDRSRNNVIERFLVEYPYATHLLFWDCDILAPGGSIQRMLSYNKPIVSGLYVQKMPPFYPLMNVRIAPNVYRHIINWQDGALADCDSAGFGFTLIRRDVLQDMEPPWSWMSATSQCILPGQTVYGDNKPIEQLKIGDNIITSKGLGKVLNTWEKSYKGDVLTITPQYFRLPIKCTPQHHILTKRGWLEAKDIVRGDHVAIPVIPSRDIDFLDVKEYSTIVTREKNERLYSKGSRSSGIPKTIKLTPSMLKVFGLFVAEGFSSVFSNERKDSGSIGFSFSHDESHLASFVKDTIEKELNLPAIIKRDHNDNIAIIVQSNILSRMFRDWFGTLANNKHVPDWLLELPKAKISFFLEGAFIGDGNVSPKAIVYNTASKTLATQMALLLTKVDIIPSVRESEQGQKSFKPGSKIYLVGTGRLDYYNILARILNKPLREDEKSRITNVFFDDEKAWYPIDSIESIHYEGKVYDIQASPSNDYLLESFIVHNSEDYYFFSKAQKFGHRVLVDTGVKLGHIGDFIYSPNNFLPFQKAELEKSAQMGISVKNRQVQESVK